MLKQLNNEFFYLQSDMRSVYGKPLESDSFIILLVEKGTAVFNISNTDYEVNERKMLLLRAKLPFLPKRLSDEFCATIIGFPSSMLHEHTTRIEPSYFMMLYTRIVWPLVDSYKCLINNFKSLYSFASSGIVGEFSREIVLSLVTGFVYAFHGSTGDKLNSKYTDSSRSRELFHKFIELLNESYTAEHEVQFYASQLCITPKYLTQITKRLVGRTPKQMINERLIHEATDLLNKHEYSIQTISVKLGFVDQSYFGRFFKRIMSMSPQQYRVPKK